MNIVSFPAVNEVKNESQDSYTQFKNKLLEAIYTRDDLSARDLRILLVIVRQAYGYHKEAALLSWSKLEELSGIAKRHISTLVKKLSEKNILNVSGSGGVREIGINPNIEEWAQIEKLPKSGKEVPESGNLPNAGNNLPKSGKKLPEIGKHIKENNKKNIKYNITPLSPPKGQTSEKSKPGKAKPKATKKRATATPDQLPITPDMVQWANDNGLQVDLVTETAKFLDYHRAKGSTFKCWASAWRNWIRNAQKFAMERGARVMPAGGYSMAQPKIEEQTDWVHDLGDF
ncbi:replication protein [Zooshikella sp. RANM57]|uniref:replication protein n=1 Tax=Zooshikella sp. RANM57 TaxID=3425863 RepID=UPI003D6FDA7D